MNRKYAGEPQPIPQSQEHSLGTQPSPTYKLDCDVQNIDWQMHLLNGLQQRFGGIDNGKDASEGIGWDTERLVTMGTWHPIVANLILDQYPEVVEFLIENALADCLCADETSLRKVVFLLSQSEEHGALFRRLKSKVYHRVRVYFPQLAKEFEDALLEKSGAFGF